MSVLDRSRLELKSGYEHSVSNGTDEIKVWKPYSSDWTQIELVTNGNQNGLIEVRGLEMLEHLHFMLGQVLGG